MSNDFINKEYNDSKAKLWYKNRISVYKIVAQNQVVMVTMNKKWQVTFFLLFLSWDYYELIQLHKTHIDTIFDKFWTIHD